jgi:predicted RNA-binding protein with PUA domain
MMPLQERPGNLAGIAWHGTTTEIVVNGIVQHLGDQLENVYTDSVILLNAIP